MKKSRYTEEQIIGILKQHEAGLKAADLCWEHGISAATFYGWKSKYGGMDVSEAQRLRAMEDENRRLKSAIPKNEEELLDQLEDCFSDVERLCSRLSQVNLNGIGPIGLTRYATFLEYMKTRPAKVLDLQMQRTAGLAEVDVMVAYTELQNAVVMERAMMAQREPKRAKELEKASPLAARLNELGDDEAPRAPLLETPWRFVPDQIGGGGSIGGSSETTQSVAPVQKRPA